jgi:hypothetical protein
MPDGHHVLRRGDGLTVCCSFERDAIGDDEGGSVQFGLDVADGEVGELPLVILIKGGGAVEQLAGRHSHVVGSENALDFGAIMRLNLFPENTLEGFRAGSFGEAAGRTLLGDGAGQSEQ